MGRAGFNSGLRGGAGGGANTLAAGGEGAGCAFALGGVLNMRVNSPGWCLSAEGPAGISAGGAARTVGFSKA